MTKASTYNLRCFCANHYTCFPFKLCSYVAPNGSTSTMVFLSIKLAPATHTVAALSPVLWPTVETLYAPLLAAISCVLHMPYFFSFFFFPPPLCLAFTSCPLISCHFTLTSPSLPSPPPLPPPPPLVPDRTVLIVPSRFGWKQRSIGRWHLLSEPWKESGTLFVYSSCDRRGSSIKVVKIWWRGMWKWETCFGTRMLCLIQLHLVASRAYWLHDFQCFSAHTCGLSVEKTKVLNCCLLFFSRHDLDKICVKLTMLWQLFH